MLNPSRKLQFVESDDDGFEQGGMIIEEHRHEHAEESHLDALIPEANPILLNLHRTSELRYHSQSRHRP